MLARIVGDSLYRNSILLIASNVIQGGLGFVYWMLASRLFRPSEVGVTTAVLGAATLVSSAATLGMPNALLRFLAAENDQRRLVTAALVVTTCFAFGAGFVWSGTPGHFGTPLDRVQPSWAALIMAPLLAGAMTASTVGDAAFIARRESRLVLGKNAIGALAKLAILPVVAGFGVAGLLGSLVLGAALSSVAGLVLLGRKVGIGWESVCTLSPRSLKTMASYAAGNHFAYLVALVPTTTLPAIVVATLGARPAAFLAMPLLIIGFANVIPAMTAQSLFAETSSEPGALRRQVRKALTSTYTLALPANLVLAAAAPLILSTFGPDYASGGTVALRLMAAGALIGCMNYVGDVILLVRSGIGAYIFVNVAGTLVVMAALITGLNWGVPGVGWGWIAGQAGYAIVLVLTLAFCFRDLLSPGEALSASPRSKAKG